MAKMLVKTFGTPDPKALHQLYNCGEHAFRGVLNADNHLGYSMPIGGAIAYEEHISPSGVGFDIGCGNKAVQLDMKIEDLDVEKAMELIWDSISFGVGQKNNKRVDSKVLEDIGNSNIKEIRDLQYLASTQLGTIGSGNHYVDLFAGDDGHVWVGVHFGSRGFGYKIANGFLAMSQGKGFNDRFSERMDAPAVLFHQDSDVGRAYLEGMELAGNYAYAGRDWVCDEVARLLGAKILKSVHNHHNFAWREEHYGKKYWVVRKGCTPAFPDQESFVGSNMRDISVIIKGKDGEDSKEALYSTVHGAGRVMGRRQAKKELDWDAIRKEVYDNGVQLKGAGADEAPQAYKTLTDVLEAQGDTIEVLVKLKPVGVAMAGKDDFDPYKD